MKTVTTCWLLKRGSLVLLPLPKATLASTRDRRLGASEVAAVTLAFASALREHEEPINRLNVYPVPDGDTGTNMALTVQSVVAELDELGADGQTVSAVCQALAHGSLMGARGNSGVILSQLLRGLAGVISAAEGADGEVLAEALSAASVAADGAVLRPVEGTILTVARSAAEGARAAAGQGGDLMGVLESAAGGGGGGARQDARAIAGAGARGRGRRRRGRVHAAARRRPARGGQPRDALAADGGGA